MKLDEIVDRLKAVAMPPLRLVGKSADMPSAQGQSRGAVQSPSAYVLPIGDNATPNRFATGAHIQEVAETFGILIVVRDLSDAKGGAAASSFSAVKGAVRDALISWTPNNADMPIDLVDGRMVDVINGEVWWLERYRSTSQLRK
jgi:hypothetical protein